MKRIPLKKEEIGDRLRQAREELGKDAAQFAELIDVNRTSYYDYERGSEPRSTVIANAAVKTEKSADWFLIREEQEGRPATEEEQERDNRNIELCVIALRDLADLCRGAKQDPIQVFANHLGELREMVREVGDASVHTTIMPASAVGKKMSKNPRVSGPDRIAGDQRQDYGKKKDKDQD